MQWIMMLNNYELLVILRTWEKYCHKNPKNAVRKSTLNVMMSKVCPETFPECPGVLPQNLRTFLVLVKNAKIIQLQ